MALYAMADNGVNIKAVRDAVLYDALAGHKDAVFGGIGNELACTASNLVITMANGMCLLQGRHITNEGTETLQLDADSQGYIVIRYDLTQAPGNEVSLLAVPSVIKNDLNNNGTIRDMELYEYTTNGTQAILVDKRLIKKDLGSLDVSTLTATPDMVLSGKIFYGSGSEDPQTGTMTNNSSQTNAVSVTTNTNNIYARIPKGAYLTEVSDSGYPEIVIPKSTINTSTSYSLAGSAEHISGHTWEKTITASRSGIAELGTQVAITPGSGAYMAIYRNGTQAAKANIGGSGYYNTWAKVYAGETIKYYIAYGAAGRVNIHAGIFYI